jgi:hypothetical protein
MEEAPENGKESSHSARANGMNECMGMELIRFINTDSLSSSNRAKLET